MYIREWEKIEQSLQKHLQPDVEFSYEGSVRDSFPNMIGSQPDKNGIASGVYDDPDYNDDAALKLLVHRDLDNDANFDKRWMYSYCGAIKKALSEEGYNMDDDKTLLTNDTIHIIFKRTFNWAERIDATD